MFDNNVTQWLMENEPSLARIFSLITIAYMVSIAGYRLAGKFMKGTTEQEELFKFLKGLLSSSNGWTRTDGNNIKYASLTSANGTMKPEIKFSWTNGAVAIFVGNDAVHSNTRLTKRQIRQLAGSAKKIADELDGQARAGDINRLLASVR